MSNLALNTPKKLSLAFLVVALILASIEPIHYPSYLLHQSGTLIMLAFLFWVNWRFVVSSLAFVAYNVFLVIHIIAAHWLYSYVPYNDWFIALLGLDINQTFGFGRNMFDRVVHFAYGLLLYPMIFELLGRWLSPLKANKQHIIGVGFVMASSMVYELIEWWIAISLSASTAENYNGQQGDIWDAHKDMFLATLGSILAVMFRLFYDNLKKP